MVYPDCFIVQMLFWPPRHKVLQNKPGSHPYKTFLSLIVWHDDLFPPCS